MNPHLQRLLSTWPLGIDLGLLILRLWFGLALAFAHGWGKVSDLAGFTGKVASKVPLAEVLAPAAAFSEFFGGLLVAIGLATRPAAGFMLITMAVAGFHIHAADPFGKKELAFSYAVAALALLLAGAGRFSLDARIGQRASR
jgi:putative oxidoreductase